MGQKSSPELEIWIGSDHLKGNRQEKQYHVGFRASAATEQVLGVLLHNIWGWHQVGFKSDFNGDAPLRCRKEAFQLGRPSARQGLHSNIFWRDLGLFIFLLLRYCLIFLSVANTNTTSSLFLAQRDEDRAMYYLNSLVIVRNFRYLL